METKKYDKISAITYAKKWAMARNPKYYNFDNFGGDCTSFVSQCLFAGSKKMNFNYENGWYYNNGYDKSPSWSGVKYLYNFLTKNKSYGPRGIASSIDNIELGDVVQLSFDGTNFSHSLIIVDINFTQQISLNNIYVAAHTYDVLNKKINDYEYKVFQTYFIPQEEYKDNDILNFTIDSMDVLPDNNQLGESQKRIHISDNYKIQVKKNERIAQIDNISVTTSDKKMFQKVDYVATSPIQTTIKITTKLSNIDYNEIINTNNNNYISNINYEIYDENNNALSFYKIELSKKIIYSDGKKEELELDEPIASEDLKDAEIELTQYIICEKNTSALTINTVNDQNTVLNKLNIKLEE